MTLEKSARFLSACSASLGRSREDKHMFREQAQKGGGLAGLSGSGQYDNRARLRGALQTGFNSARNPPMQNIRYNRIFCTPSQNSKMVFRPYFMLTTHLPRERKKTGLPRANPVIEV
jgi:hypothetical protein